VLFTVKVDILYSYITKILTDVGSHADIQILAEIWKWPACFQYKHKNTFAGLSSQIWVRFFFFVVFFCHWQPQDYYPLIFSLLEPVVQSADPRDS